MRDVDFVEVHLAPLWERDRAALRHEQAVALLVWSATGLVENGGFAALVEALGEDAASAADAFREVGLPGRAEVLSDGLALFPRYAHPDPSVRLSLPLSRRLGASRRLDEAEATFYALDEVESGGRSRRGLRAVAPRRLPAGGGAGEVGGRQQRQREAAAADRRARAGRRAAGQSPRAASTAAASSSSAPGAGSTSSR